VTTPKSTIIQKRYYMKVNIPSIKGDAGSWKFHCPCLGNQKNSWVLWKFVSDIIKTAIEIISKI
jgi:hypothetical protein